MVQQATSVTEASAGKWVIAGTVVLSSFVSVIMLIMFSPLSAVVMRTVPLTMITAASSLYTLGRRIGSNVGYAFVASQVVHRAMLHRARLIDHVTPYDLRTNLPLDGLTSRLATSSGLPPGVAEDSAIRLLDVTLNRHASILDYNDIFWLMGMMFVIGVPFCCF